MIWLGSGFSHRDSEGNPHSVTHLRALRMPSPPSVPCYSCESSSSPWLQPGMLAAAVSASRAALVLSRTSCCAPAELAQSSVLIHSCSSWRGHCGHCSALAGVHFASHGSGSPKDWHLTLHCTATIQSALTDKHWQNLSCCWCSTHSHPSVCYYSK